MGARRRRRPVAHRLALPVDPDLAPDDPGEPSRTRVHGAPVRRLAHPSVLLAIFLGGALGSLARYEAELAWSTRRGSVPWATLLINTTGALFLGVVLTLVLEHPAAPRLLRPFLCVGFTGAWTTMSTFALESDLLVQDGHGAVAVLYVGLTLVLGVASAMVGIALGRRFGERHLEWSSRS